MPSNLERFKARIQHWGGGVYDEQRRDGILVVRWRLGNQVQIEPEVLDLARATPEALADLMAKASLYEIRRVLNEKIADFEANRGTPSQQPTPKTQGTAATPGR